ncbi:MAG TPA: hypothetical protein VH573_17950 [Mycobacteriales bacterium]
MPTCWAAPASNADFAGLRMAFPVRSARMSTVATARPAAPRNGVTASRGTDTAVSAYPAIVTAQYRRLRSASIPEASRSSKATASPAPVIAPTASADAPSDDSSGPYSDRPPS